MRADFDVEIVAGDCAGRLTDSVRWLADRYAGVPTVYVPGNHDYYRTGGPDGFHVEGEVAAAHDLAAGTDVRLLTDGTTTIGDVRLVGGTLWSDLRATIRACGTAGEGRKRARRGMNDHRRIHRASSTKGSRRIAPEDTLRWHRGTVRFLEGAFAAPHDGPIVVVTHHAPTHRGYPDPYDDLPGTVATTSRRTSSSTPREPSLCATRRTALT